jgi:chromate transporter
MINTDKSTKAEQPSLWLLFRVWFGLGVQSFGGGTATLFLIRRAVVERYGWVTAEAFTRDWVLCRVAPGINLLAITILMGRQVAGLGGALVSLVGLLLPSVTITIVMTALYADLRMLPAMQAALRGIVPATVGLGLLLSTGMVRPMLTASRQESQGSLLVSLLILVGSAGAVIVWELPVVLVLCSAGLLGALTLWWQPRPEKRDQP